MEFCIDILSAGSFVRRYFYPDSIRQKDKKIYKNKEET